MKHIRTNEELKLFNDMFRKKGIESIEDTPDEDLINIIFDDIKSNFDEKNLSIKSTALGNDYFIYKLDQSSISVPSKKRASDDGYFISLSIDGAKFKKMSTTRALIDKVSLYFESKDKDNIKRDAIGYQRKF